MASSAAARENTKKLIDAILDNKPDAASKFLNGEVDFHVEIRGDYPIHVAARVGKLELIKKMKNKGANLQQQNVNKNTPMHYAARGGYLDVIKYLTDNAADLNPTNRDGESPLHLAVITQPMDVIETLVNMGMNPNRQSKESGQTPLHTALMFGRMEAMEALLIKGAKPTIVDNKKQKAEDVAKTAQIRDSLRMYRALLSAMESGYIEAKGMKISRQFVNEPQQIERVNIRLESMDIPKEFATGFYCRREKSENSTVKLPKNDEEQIFSDVFYLRVSDVNRDCPARINLPLYSAPSDKEEMVLRFIDYEADDRTVKEVSQVQKVNYCLLETTLIPETTCVCVVFVRPKKEENTVTGEGMVIKSEIEENFSMDIPPGAFEEETKLSLKVYESNDSDYVEGESLGDATEGQNAKEDNSSKQKGGLLSDVFQINVSGQQPKKGVKMQMPLSVDMKNMKQEDISIVTGDETQLEDNENAVTVSESKPQIVNGMIVFEVSHFCIYVAVPKEKVASTTDLRAVQRQISSARDRRKPATFFVVAKKVEQRGYAHTIVVECLSSARSGDRRNRLVVDKGYEPQTPDESESIMMTPGDTFNLTIAGKASFEEESDGNRKLTFSPNRTSTQAYTILLDADVTEEVDAIGEVIVNKQLEDGTSKEVSRLKVQLHPPPPRPPTPPTPTPSSQLDQATKPNERRDSVVSMDRHVPTPSRTERSQRRYSNAHKETTTTGHANYDDDNPTSTKAKLKSIANIYQPKGTPHRYQAPAKPDKSSYISFRNFFGIGQSKKKDKE